MIILVRVTTNLAEIYSRYLLNKKSEHVATTPNCSVLFIVDTVFLTSKY